MFNRRRAGVLAATVLALSACAGQGADIPNVICVGEATTYLDWINDELAIAEPEAIQEPADMSDPNDLLNIVKERGTLVVSTDPNYAPQSFLEPDGTFVGFDIDVATEIADRLGVGIEFETPEWEAITAGSWSERWDVSVGSMTVTEERKDVLSFTQPYYYTPAQLAASESSGITTLDEIPFELQGGAEATTLPTDANCAEAIEAGRSEFDLWISSSTTVRQAVDADIPLVEVGDPLFAEPLSVAFDKSGPPHDALLFEIDRIIGEMHEDGTLTALSEQWYDGLDLTQGTASAE